jgi:hypothetical protein
LLFFVLPFITAAQDPHPILRSFSAIRQPNGIALKWVIKGGKQCDGTWVFRADESLVFEEINHVEGICGDFTEDETYTYFDSEPISNRYNHYKLEMGFQGLTDTIVVFFEDFGSDGYLLLTQPNGSYRILFSNDNNREATIQVFDVSGKLMFEDAGIDNDFNMEPSGWRAGAYVFRISGVAEGNITGKLYFSGQ